MIKLIVGKKGTGKTKVLVDMVAKAANTSNGNVVCIEKEPKLTFDIPSSVRLMETCKDGITGYGEFYGYITGVLSGNFDITDLFIDSTLKIGGRDYEAFGAFLEKLNKAIGSRDVNVVFTVSAEAEELPASVKAYIG
ncbi:MAG: hypothetical protein HFE45_05940 [Oscillospiraceae bacterium]|jgi:hypothetical protein|nr:hypothetical protein [Oscillospiraceae bacterium]